MLARRARRVRRTVARRGPLAGAALRRARPRALLLLLLLLSARLFGRTIRPRIRCGRMSLRGACVTAFRRRCVGPLGVRLVRLRRGLKDGHRAARLRRLLRRLRRFLPSILAG